MRTAHRRTKTESLSWIAFSFLAGFFGLLSFAHAASPPPPIQAPTSPASAAPQTSAPQAPVANLPPPDSAPPMVPPTGASAGSDDGEKGGKGLSNAEDKISDNVKNVIKHMNATDSITLDDLNSAHQAVAKIDALIEVEKRLTELEKIRNEREGRTFSPVSASSLMAAPAMAVPLPMSSMQPPSAMYSAASMEVSRIMGSAGHYTALIRAPDGQTKTVEIGDSVGSGKVISITASGVELEQGKTKHLLSVKDIQMVSDRSP